MSTLPRQSGIKSLEQVPDNYVKNILFGAEPNNFIIPDHVKVFNKPGWAYGFMTDVAYIADQQSGIEFLLAVQILVNENDIFNDGQYQYEQTGALFMGKLGEAIYAYEQSRPRDHRPDLSKFFQNR